MTKLTMTPKDKALREGFVPYAGPYATVSERDMLDRAVADIVQNKRDKHCLVSLGGNRAEIWIKPNHFATNIYKHVEEDALTSSL